MGTGVQMNIPDTLPIQVSAAALEKLHDLLIHEQSPDQGLRIFVQGGGCAGFSYGFTFDQQQDDDLVLEYGDVKVYVDSMSLQYLAGSEVDYRETFMDSNFVINNPNANTTCGCGSSFSLSDNFFEMQ